MPKRTNNDFEMDMGYKMSMSEFKGQTINALQNINENIKTLQQGQQNLQNQLNGQKLLAAVIGGVSGIISAVISPFKNI